jgi:hypothetical protein
LIRWGYSLERWNQVRLVKKYTNFTDRELDMRDRYRIEELVKNLKPLPNPAMI